MEGPKYLKAQPIFVTEEIWAVSRSKKMALANSEETAVSTLKPQGIKFGQKSECLKTGFSLRGTRKKCSCQHRDSDLVKP